MSRFPADSIDALVDAVDAVFGKGYLASDDAAEIRFLAGGEVGARAHGAYYVLYEDSLVELRERGGRTEARRFRSNGAVEQSPGPPLWPGAN